MTTTTDHVQSILETLDRQLMNPLAGDVTITMSRDEAAALIASQSEDHTLRLWTSGYGSGQASAMASTLSAVGKVTDDKLDQITRIAMSRCCEVWLDPAMRQEALDSAAAAVDAPTCNCGAPLPSREDTK